MPANSTQKGINMEIFWADVAVLQAMRAMLRVGQSQAATYAAFEAWLAKKEVKK